MITFTNLADSDHSHFAQSLFEEAFPEQERPPFSSLRHRDAGKFHFLVAENGDEPVGILTYWTFEDLVYIEHFAIAEELRNQGLGKVVFLNFLSQQTQQIVLEVEKPHDEVSENRIEFYSSMGLITNPFDYLQPSYHGDQVTVPMIIMTKYEINDEEFEEIRDILYRQVYKSKPSRF
jgi:GNAT superfamily N-acetyltransferase